ncbi:MAG: glutathione synthase, partial [Deltaproteobacteria bacterium]
MNLSVCFVMDPLEDVLLDKDTTLVLMLECQRRGHRVAVVETPGLFLEGGRLFGRIREVSLDLSADPFFSILRRGIEPLDAFDVVWMRKDPPFDMAYIFATMQLLHLPPSTLVMNDPRGILLAN